MVFLNFCRCVLKKWTAPQLPNKGLSRCLSHRKSSFKFSDLEINLIDPSKSKAMPDQKDLVFGKCFSDHMLEIEWTNSAGWGKPCICPLHNLDLHPASKVLHYAQELFEGMKAFRCSKDNRILLFRPLLNLERMTLSAKRAALPYFDRLEFLQCMKKLISIDKKWVPTFNSSSLYIRPTFIGTESSLGVAPSNRALLYVITSPVGPYFNAAAVTTPVSLLADPNYVRSWPGGIGDRKMGANYASSLYIQAIAQEQGLQQVLWLNGDDHRLAEVGAMNIFVYLINSSGEKELVTPPLDGTILPGIVRHSLLELAKEWKEFKVSERNITMEEIISANRENRLLEMFGSGTACIVCPVESIKYLGNWISIPTMKSEDLLNARFFKQLQDIQYGRIESKWSESIE